MKTCDFCQSPMWDNRQRKLEGKMKSNAPDFKCRDEKCGNTIWPEKPPEQKQGIKPSSGPETGLKTPCRGCRECSNT